MLARLLLTAAVVCLFNGSLARAELSPGQQVKDASDIIYGRADAPHEMVLYFSPGCLPCLRTFHRLNLSLRTYYADRGHLRLVLRDVPQYVSQHGGNTDEESTRQALRTSFTLGLFMRCHYRHGGAERYYRALSSLSAAVVAQYRDNNEDISNWPHVSSDTLEKVTAHITKDGMNLTAEQETTCDQPFPRRMADDAFRNNFKAFQEFSTAEGRPAAVPAYVVDGHWLNSAGQTPLGLNASVRELLQQKIPEAKE